MSEHDFYLTKNSFLSNNYGAFLTEIGSRRERPLKMLAPMMTQSFGDMFNFTAVAARYAVAFDHSFCSFLVDASRPYTRDIVAFYPFEHQVLTVNGSWGDIPLLGRRLTNAQS
jgi:hypothetical protein